MDIDEIILEEGIDLSQYLWLDETPIGNYHTDGYLRSSVTEYEQENYEWHLKLS